MQTRSIAECSKGSILQYFRPSLSYHFPLRPLFCLFLSGRLRQEFTVLMLTEHSHFIEVASALCVWLLRKDICPLSCITCKSEKCFKSHYFFFFFFFKKFLFHFIFTVMLIMLGLYQLQIYISTKMNQDM